MIFLFLLITAALAENGTDIITCDGLIFHNVYYDKELLFQNLGRPYNLVMHKFSGILFFSHTIENGTQVDFSIMACHVAKKNCLDIKGVSGGYAVAYDPGNDDIYFGGHTGIYKYNFLTKAADFFAEDGKSIWGIFIRRHFYYIEYPSQQLHVYQEDHFVRVLEAIKIEIDHFFIAKDKNIFFANKTALYKVDRGTKDPIVLDDDVIVRQISEDAYGDTYFLARDGIYIEDKPYHRLKRVARINDAFGLTFDELDHIIYSDKNAIYKLTPSKHTTACYDALTASNEDFGRSNDRMGSFFLNI